MGGVIQGKALVAGRAEGAALVSGEPLSFWGGYDHETGEITDRRHPLSGANAAGRVLALPYSRGSSTTAAVLLEALRSGTAPAAIITVRDDPFFALASIVAGELYGRAIPVISISPTDFATLMIGDRLRVQLDGQIQIP
jgi:predicted aconitase with swiveling domain